MKLGITLIEGLLVSEINDPNGCCATGGITVGDILTGVNNQPGAFHIKIEIGFLQSNLTALLALILFLSLIIFSHKQ